MPSGSRRMNSSSDPGRCVGLMSPTVPLQLVYDMAVLRSFLKNYITTKERFATPPRHFIIVYQHGDSAYLPRASETAARRGRAARGFRHPRGRRKQTQMEEHK